MRHEWDVGPLRKTFESLIEKRLAHEPTFKIWNLLHKGDYLEKVKDVSK